MNYYLDTEFEDKGPAEPIKLISIGIVAEDGRELYYENRGIWHNALNDWLKQHVVPHLTGPAIPYDQIGQKIVEFVGNDLNPRFWGYYADYDWVLFCSLFGGMLKVPPHFPQFCLDLKQILYLNNLPRPIIPYTGPVHNALVDARWTKELHEWIKKINP